MIARDLEAVQRPNGQSRPLEDKAARRATDPLALTHLNFLEGSGCELYPVYSASNRRLQPHSLKDFIPKRVQNSARAEKIAPALPQQIRTAVDWHGNSASVQ
jgi:hypothetical protein